MVEFAASDTKEAGRSERSSCLCHGVLHQRLLEPFGKRIEFALDLLVGKTEGTAVIAMHGSRNVQGA